MAGRLISKSIRKDICLRYSTASGLGISHVNKKLFVITQTDAGSVRKIDRERALLGDNLGISILGNVTFNRDGFVGCNVGVIDTYKMSEAELAGMSNVAHRHILSGNLFSRILCDNEVSVKKMEYFKLFIEARRNFLEYGDAYADIFFQARRLLMHLLHLTKADESLIYKAESGFMFKNELKSYNKGLECSVLCEPGFICGNVQKFVDFKPIKGFDDCSYSGTLLDVSPADKVTKVGQTIIGPLYCNQGRLLDYGQMCTLVKKNGGHYAKAALLDLEDAIKNYPYHLAFE